jgi:hypothetical protein
MTEAYEDVEEDESGFVYRVGNVGVEVCWETDSQSTPSSAREFAADFTRNFDEICIYFPEFLKLKELKKMSLIYQKLNELLIENGAGGRTYSHYALSELGIKIKTKDSESCTRSRGARAWVPSNSCHMEYPEPFEVVGGVRILKSQPIPGFVSISPTTTLVPARDLIQEFENEKYFEIGDPNSRFFFMSSVSVANPVEDIEPISSFDSQPLVKDEEEAEPLFSDRSESEEDNGPDIQGKHYTNTNRKQVQYSSIKLISIVDCRSILCNDAPRGLPVNFNLNCSTNYGSCGKQLRGRFYAAHVY